MTEYDNTNSGAVFKPRDVMKMILQGKLNLEGNDRTLIVVSDTSQAGKKYMKLYQKVGAMFSNDKEVNEKRPDFAGKLEDYATNKDMVIAAWTKDKDGNKYMTLSIEEKRGASPSQELNDEIPF